MEAAGIETVAYSSGNNACLLAGDAQDDALKIFPADPRLMAIVDAWPTLDEDVRDRIVALVR